MFQTKYTGSSRSPGHSTPSSHARISGAVRRGTRSTPKSGWESGPTRCPKPVRARRWARPRSTRLPSQCVPERPEHNDHLHDHHQPLTDLGLATLQDLSNGTVLSPRLEEFAGRGDG
jgi:hypothetical protein